MNWLCRFGIHDWEDYGYSEMTGWVDNLDGTRYKEYKFNRICINCGKVDKLARREHLRYIFRKNIRNIKMKKVLKENGIA